MRHKLVEARPRSVARRPTDHDIVPLRERFVVWVLALGALDFGLEQFMVVPILPAVQREEGATLAASTWLLTGFLLAAMAAAPVIGRLGDMYGRRRLLLASVGAFAAGSLVCAASGSVAGLIAGRVVQGLGAALGPLAIGLARDRAPQGRAPVWIGLLVAAAGAGAALGLLLGGALVDYVSVAAVFWFLFALAALLLVAVWAFVPETPVREGTRPDWLGGLLLTSALLSALLAISEGNSWGWDSAVVLLLSASSAVMLITFVLVERSVAAPLLDMRLMSQRAAWSANFVAFAMGFALFIAGVVVPQIAALPEASGYGFGMTFAQIGLLLTPGAFAIVLGGWASGALVRTTGARPLVAAGAVVAAVAYAVLALAHESVAAVAVANSALGLGVGLAFAALTNLVVRSVADDRTSVFAATTAVSRSTGAALGAQMAAAIVIGAGLLDAGVPAERGFTGAFVLALLATFVALAATAVIPGRTSDPLRAATASS
jgi:MFS family permease